MNKQRFSNAHWAIFALTMLSGLAYLGIHYNGWGALMVSYDKMRLRYEIIRWYEVWPSLAIVPEQVDVPVNDTEVLTTSARFGELLIRLSSNVHSREIEGHFEVVGDDYVLTIFKPEISDPKKWFFSKEALNELLYLKPLSEKEMASASVNDLVKHLALIKHRASIVPYVSHIQINESKEGFGVFIQQSDRSFNGFFWPTDTTACISVHCRTSEERPMDSRLVIRICQKIELLNN